MGSITVTALETVTGIVEIVLPGPQGPVGDVNPQMFTLRDAAQTAATSAQSSATSASGSAATATTQATRSADWAEKTVGTVDGVGYSSKYHAQLASTSAQTATTKASEASASATSASGSASTASTKASEASTSATNAAASAAAAATSATDTANALVGERSAVATLTNKTVNLSNNTLTGTTAQFNAALTDGDFATLAGAETLTNKTITGGTTNPTTLQEGGVDAVIQSDIGTEPNKIPLNQYLGPLAYRDENPAGAVVGTTAVQVLSGKSFSDNVGIGTSSPTGKLHVVGSAGGTYIDAAGNQIVMTRAGTNYLISNDPASSLELRAPLYTFKSENGVTERLRIDSSGNLGIGASSPAYKLDVLGNARIQQSSYADAILRIAQGPLTTGNTSQILFQDQETNTTASISAFGTAFGSGLNGALRIGTVGGAAILDASGNLGLGVTPSAWSTLNAIDVSSWASFAGFTNQAGVLGNTYFDGSNYRYKTTAVATRYEQNSLGTHAWYTAPSGTAGSPISFTQAMTLDASGHLLIGATSSDGAGSSRAQIGSASAATTGLLLKSNTSSASLYASSTSSSYLSWKTGTFMALGTAPDNLGTFSEAARITSEGYLRMAAGSGGIQFNGDTAAANALDDYEEGTFTPTIVGTTTAGVGTYTTQVGRYTKVGNRVFFTCRISMSAHNGAGNMSITGLPFTSNATSGSENPSYFGFAINLALSAGSIPIASVGPNSTQITLRQLPTGGGTNDAIPLDTAADLSIGGHYDV